MSGSRLRESDVAGADGRTVHVYDTGGSGVPVLWHHGTPNVGSPPEPLFELAGELGLRWIGVDRPGYGGSTRLPGRTVAAVSDDVMAVADALHLDALALVGYSGGGPHALAAAARLGERALAVVVLAGLAPIDAEGLDWFAGMGPTGTAALRAAQAGVDARQEHEVAAADAPIDFTAADWAALTGPWGWLATVAAAGVATGVEGLIDDDVAYVTPWGVALSAVRAPVLLVHGADDHVVPPAHGAWLAAHLASAELWRLEGESHISTLAAEQRGAADALRWLAERVPR